MLESTDASQAVIRYRQALVDMRKYEAMTLERGLVAEMGVGPNWGDPNILDRLTLCLIKLGRLNEAIEETDHYFASFPSALKLAVGKRVIVRVNKVREKAGK